MNIATSLIMSYCMKLEANAFTHESIAKSSAFNFCEDITSSNFLLYFLDKLNSIFAEDIRIIYKRESVCTQF